MTCIIAHRDGWMVADQRVSWDHQVGPFREEKVISCRGALVGLAGRADCKTQMQLALDNAPANADLLHVISQALRNDCDKEGIGILTLDGKLYELGRGGSYHEVIGQAYWAIGSGYQLALGYIAGSKQDLTPELAQAAIEFAATLVTDVGDGTKLYK